MKTDTLESLKFYIDALSTHRKAGKCDSDFIDKLNKMLLVDELTSEVYEMMVHIIKKPEMAGLGIPKNEIPVKAAKKPKEAPKPKAEAKSRVDTERPSGIPSSPRKRTLDSDTLRRIRSLLSFMTFYVKGQPSPTQDGYRPATANDVLEGYDIFQGVASGFDPCRGPTMRYTKMNFDDFIDKVWNPLGSVSGNGSCGGNSSAPKNTGSCSSSSSPTGRC